MAKYLDLLIENDEIAADQAGMTIWITDREVIQQDIVHRIRESGILNTLIGERSPATQALAFKKIRMLVEQDLRVVPGTSSLEVQKGKIYISADTEFGKINVAGI